MRLLIVRHAVAMEREEFHASAREKAREIISSRTSKRNAAAARRIEGLLTETDDDFRPLTEEGIRKLRKGAKGLRRLVGRPDFLVSSPLTRALQTAEILREGWGEVDTATTEFLRPGSEPAELLTWLLGQPQCTSSEPLVCLVGHEPHLSSLASWLMSEQRFSQIVLKKGGACLFELELGATKRRARLEWLLTPKMLRDLR